jgi:glycosyltransferase involved in cell wall biosynthesis
LIDRGIAIPVERTPASVSEALVGLAESSATRERLARVAPAIVREYTWERSVDRMLEIYRTLLEPRSARATTVSASATW